MVENAIQALMGFGSVALVYAMVVLLAKWYLAKRRDVEIGNRDTNTGAKG